MKKILGLDLGTNSIGWALVQQDFENKEGEILGMGTRVIPMSQDILGEFGKGNSVSQTAERTRFRSARRLRERYLLRRERLHRVLNVLAFLPEHYAAEIDFEKRLGKFIGEAEPKLAYKKKDTGSGYEFIFKKSFDEMLADFRINQPQILENDKGEVRRLPYDWTLYYLRKKALNQKIEKEELAWLLLNFNQKRGYYQLRGEEEEEISDKSVEFHSLKIVEVLADEAQKGRNDIWYSLVLENGWVYRRSSKIPLFDWKDKIRDFIVTTDLNADGSVKKDKEGREKRSFRAPGEDDWTLLKKKTEQEIGKSEKTVGAYVYDALLQNPRQKIKGKLIRTIERKFYKEELKQILEKQKEFHPELQSEDLYADCTRELYRNNDAHRELLAQKDILHLFLNDIIFYQRPLRSQKSSVANCSLEHRKYKDEKGSEHIRHLKAVSKSNPYYQEFRIWQWISNLSVYRKEDDLNVTADFLGNTEDREALFEFLDNRKEIEQKALIKNLLEKKGFKGKPLNAELEKYRWNYVEDKKYPCNETKALIAGKLSKTDKVPDGFLTKETEYQIWHIIYSVTDKFDYEKALGSFAEKHLLDRISFVEAFKKIAPFKAEYGTFSEKAIRKLLPLLRQGKYWRWEAIDERTRNRIHKLLNGEYDAGIRDRVREKAIHLEKMDDFQGLQLWLAQYVVYDRHSEAAFAGKWNSVTDLENYLQDFRQHSLRNPIVEQVVTETLRVVKDIWKKYGNGEKDFFHEIHIELGREMKNSAEERKHLSARITENENTNLRIKALLTEMMDDVSVENVRPYSPMQQEIMKVYEEGVLGSETEIEEDILKISKTAQPSPTDLKRYKLWLEQKYRSPYTGEIIPLNKLFTSEYEIEHIIPQSRYFDDSFGNKVICESAVNKLKDNRLGYEFIKAHRGEKVSLGFGRSVSIFKVDEYEDFVKRNYAKNHGKRSKLLMEDIPDRMIERQLNDTRYISKFVSSLLSNIVRAETNDDGVNSKNVISGNGKITNELKNDWGLNEVWNDLILPRFERMNQITGSEHFTSWSNTHRKHLPTVPLEFSKGFSKKRIDHRHHALDALVNACATRDHINLLNNRHARSNERFDLNRKLRHFEKVVYPHFLTGERIEKEVPKSFIQPWPNFQVEVKSALENIVVSFRQNLRVINKAGNRYQKWVEEAGIKSKEVQEQKGRNWAIRKPMHKDTVSGLVRLRKMKTVSLSTALNYIDDIVDKALRNEIKSLQEKGLEKAGIGKHFKGLNSQWQGQDVSKVIIYYWENDNVASRVPLDDTFDESRIVSITDTGIQKILLNHLNSYKGKIDEKGKEIPAQLLAFSPEGIEEMNKNIFVLNDGKMHQPIVKVRTYEPKGNKFRVGQTGNKKYKFVEAAKGTNLFFAIYQGASGKRNYETFPFNEIVERQKQGLSSIPSENRDGDKLLLCLSPNDLVYVPTEEEKANGQDLDFTGYTLRPENIYKVVSFTGNRIFFIRHEVAVPIVNKEEFSALNKMERALDGTMIKECCIGLKINSLGHFLNQ